MGLMTEPAWDSNPGPMSNTDFHRENLHHLKKLQARAKQRQNSVEAHTRPSRQPVKAFAMPQEALPASNAKKFGPVQPRLYDWTVSGNGPNPVGLPSASNQNGRRSPSISSKNHNFSHVQSRVHDWTAQPPEPSEKSSKPFLRGHQKTGPFLPSSAGSVIGVRRLNGLRKSNRDFMHGSEYDNVDDDIHVAMASSAGTRFSEVTIDERKRRIQSLITDIYSVTPLCKENLTQKTIAKNLRRFASSDQVSEVGSVREGSVRPVQPEGMSRYKSTSRLSRAPSSVMISSQNVEPLTRARLQKHDFREHTIRDKLHPIPQSPHFRPTVSKSQISPRPNSRHRDRSLSPHERAHSRQERAMMRSSSQDRPHSRIDRKSPHEQDRAHSRQERAISRGSPHSRSSPNFRPSRSETPNQNAYFNDDEQSVARGVDVNYVSANVEGVSNVGHNRRKEMIAANEASKVIKASLVLPDTYKSGSVPKYLKNRQMEWKDEEERREREKPDPDCPPNHVRLSDEVRLDTLSEMKNQFQLLLQELSRFSVRADSVRIRQRKRDIEEEMTKIEAKMKIYERPKVFVPKIEQ